MPPAEHDDDRSGPDGLPVLPTSVSWALARLVRDNLNAHGFDVFIDVEGIGGGESDRVLLQEIAARTYFLVLLEPRSLDRLAEPDDWLRRELPTRWPTAATWYLSWQAVRRCRAPRTCPPTSRGCRRTTPFRCPTSTSTQRCKSFVIIFCGRPPCPRARSRLLPAPPSAAFVGGASPIPETAWHEPLAPSAGKSAAEEPMQPTRPGPPPADPVEKAGATDRVSGRPPDEQRRRPHA